MVMREEWIEAGPNAQQRMVLHRGAKLSTIEAVRAVPLPELPADSRYGIVPHGSVIDLVEQRFEREVGELPVWTVAANKQGTQFFGIAARAKNPTDYEQEITPAVAVRNSYDKSTRFALGLGTKLFICDNLALSGSDVSYSRVHVGEAWRDIEIQVVGQMAKILGVFERHKEEMARLQSTVIEAYHGYRIIGIALGTNVLLPRLAQQVVKTWRKQESEFGSGHTAWRLLQHMTQALQREPARQQMPKLAAAHDLVLHEI